MSMIEVNLLPQELRRSTGGFRLPKTAVVGIAACAVLACTLGGLTLMQMSNQSKVEGLIAKAEARVESMKDDIALVDRLTSVKKSIAQRLDAIEQLDRNRGEWVHNMEDVVAVIPDYLWLTSFRRNDLKKNNQTKADSAAAPIDNDYLFEGYCYSLSSLANLILNLQDSPRFDEVALKRANFTNVKERNVYEFTLYCLMQPVDEESTGDEAANPADLGLGPDDPDAEVSMTADDVAADVDNR